MDSSTKNILIPIDFSDQAMIALSQGANFAKRLGGEVTLLKVVDDHGFMGKWFTKHEDEAKAEIQGQLDTLAKETAEKYGIKVNDMIAKGKVYEKILEVSEMINADFVVMGTSGTKGLKKRLIGSNAMHVVKDASTAVITIKGKDHREGCDTIVLPLDLTKETKQKVNKTIEMAKNFNSKVIVIAALLTKDEFVVNKLTRQLQQVQKFIEDRNIECTSEIVKGIKGEENTAEVVMEYSKKAQADLIVMMTQQETDITDLFIGSTAQQIVAESDIPVLCIVPEVITDGSHTSTQFF